MTMSTSNGGSTSPSERDAADTRKKREWRRNEEAKDAVGDANGQPPSGGEEKTKKSRGGASNSNDVEDVVAATSPPSIRAKTISQKSKSSSPSSIDTDENKSSTSIFRKDDDTKQWDLETALHHVLESKEKEFIVSHDSSKWISFRVGHGGDASTIASLYRRATTAAADDGIVEINKSKQGEDDQEEEEQQQPNDSSAKEDAKEEESLDKNSNHSNHDNSKPTEDVDALELRLASGLGDEDTPPTIFAVIVEVKELCNAEERNIKTTDAAIALLTLDWKYNQRILRVEWMYVDKTIREHDLIERRLWFRLSALALVTACQLLPVVEEAQQHSPQQQ